MNYIPTLAMQEDDLIAIVAVGGGLTLGLVGIVGGMIKSIFNTRMRETTRREIAAYVAEGSMTQEEGERLLNAGPRDRRCG